MIILGSTGSIGVNTLKVAKRFNLDVEILVAGKNIDLLNIQIKEFNPKRVVISSKDDLHRVNHHNVYFGEDAILEAIEESSSNIVVNALVGFLGLKPSLKTIECGKKLALANKESLVVAGKFIDQKNLSAIDSEHFGLWYLLQDKKIDSMTITASGGSFRDYSLEKLKNVTVKEALNHPNWNMGNKITIDSATMTNKMFELIEAAWLFNTKKIDAVIEPKSLVHAFINFKDGSTTAHLANASMQLPIAYAILGKIDSEILEPVNLLEISNLEFKKIEESRYPIWKIKNDVLNNLDLGVILNAANEVAVSKFLSNKIGFLDISKISLDAVNRFSNLKASNIDDVFLIDKEVRSYYES
ncbi:1-deoxy-D-xylulose-5-phosphate reductoisomerase [Aliarcobacter skirrowii]|uniref:1-deoxy-D-xylulose 5-phosphate reductoisomerase n=1 Tax=Aliarcobacter skirrowii CCUG 10374 TaxID=1032239 RepID=A0AAD0WMP7_9BACT|nr:1-deoxy-D-xylulose-5-phosphate reductoisomerase [Aliarcobacter skirrowii]AXX84014.1 1-deoxy-D-xylulose 5-phosphate reductoisomerase [Aliarcobacter skirrowii CCUG 10374]KAB0621797.1 1-deoxy-D-xylulose-5-phosphate reductoisomerase [Aliarcobacter skirrowii CCUG 10374]RXI27050.1 1-deoxy-D-xylulose-5-phosphate reductoisomerase [Aliarcobacter skirrowii CCUG 10374]SUU95492.1 1-deoxy-D-xylulose 5-phosphate reductoisomerase [Aliarcobacter skirrowii]HAC71710.1 1-deoxy-D-xylulose-5-phosphate reductois